MKVFTMDSGTLALLAHLFISTGCRNTDTTYREACTQGYNQAYAQTGLNKQVDSKEKELSKIAQDFTGQYIVPYVGKEALIVTFSSIDALVKGEVSYAFKAGKICDSVLVKAGTNGSILQMNWKF
jgi:hypothetical protein